MVAGYRDPFSVSVNCSNLWCRFLESVPFEISDDRSSVKCFGCSCGDLSVCPTADFEVGQKTRRDTGGPSSRWRWSSIPEHQVPTRSQSPTRRETDARALGATTCPASASCASPANSQALSKYPSQRHYGSGPRSGLLDKQYGPRLLAAHAPMPLTAITLAPPPPFI